MRNPIAIKRELMKCFRRESVQYKYDSNSGTLKVASMVLSFVEDDRVNVAVVGLMPRQRFLQYNVLYQGFERFFARLLVMYEAARKMWCDLLPVAVLPRPRLVKGDAATKIKKKSVRLLKLLVNLKPHITCLNKQKNKEKRR